MLRKNDGYRRCNALLVARWRWNNTMAIRLKPSRCRCRATIHLYSIAGPGHRPYASPSRLRQLSRPPRRSVRHRQPASRSASAVVYCRRHRAIDTTAGGVVVDAAVALWDGPSCARVTPPWTVLTTHARLRVCVCVCVCSRWGSRRRRRRRCV